MAAPWEKFQKIADTEASGPWTKFQSSTPTTEESSSFDPVKNVKQGVQYLQEKTGIPGLLGAAGEKLSSYTSAPARAAIGAAQEGQNPFSAFAHQFGENPNAAPTGTQLASKAGLSQEPILSDRYLPEALTKPSSNQTVQLLQKLAHVSPAEVGGAGLNLAADPINAIPAAGLLKKGLASTELGSQALSVAGKGAEALGVPIKKGLVKGASALSGLSENDIANYASDPAKINAIIKESGGDINQSAQDLQRTLSSQIFKKKAELGSQVGEALDQISKEKTIDPTPYTEKLNAIKSKLNSTYDADSIGMINNIVDKMGEVAGEGNQFSLKDLHDTKEFLQDQASYYKPGQLFQTNPKVNRVLRDVARDMRLDIEAQAPALKDANAQLSNLHRIDETINKNLINPEKSPTGIFTAGSEANSKNLRDLEKIEAATGYPAVQSAKDLSSARAFSSPGLLPVDTTGKSWTRMASAGLLGEAAGGHHAALPFMVLASPYSTKAAINAGSKAKGLIQNNPAYSLGLYNLLTRGAQNAQ